MTKIKNTPRHTNKKMNSHTYGLRRKVIDLIYEAKTLATLPRIDVRITEIDNPRVLGTARLGDNILWIPEKTVIQNEAILRHVVYHEICHAVFATGHNAKCKLMKDKMNRPGSKKEIHKIFKAIAKGGK